MHPFPPKQFYLLWSDWLGDGGKPVEQELAQARANTCLACPMHEHKAFWELLAAPASTWAKQQIAIKNTVDLKVKREDELHVCSVCWCVLKLKVHVPLKHITSTMPEEEQARLPETCWIRKEQAK